MQTANERQKVKTEKELGAAKAEMVLLHKELKQLYLGLEKCNSEQEYNSWLVEKLAVQKKLFGLIESYHRVVVKQTAAYPQ